MAIVLMGIASNTPAQIVNEGGLPQSQMSSGTLSTPSAATEITLGTPATKILVKTSSDGSGVMVNWADLVPNSSNSLLIDGKGAAQQYKGAPIKKFQIIVDPSAGSTTGRVSYFAN